MLKRNSVAKRKMSTAVLLLFSISILFGSLQTVGAVVNSTCYPNGYRVPYGAYLSGSVSTSLQTVDSDYFTVESSPSATSVLAHHPSAYNLGGGTAYVSGATADLASDDGVPVVYRSYQSAAAARTLYAHQEQTTVGGNSYYLEKPETPDQAGTTLSASMATAGRHVLQKFVYPLTGVTSIPASTWTGLYRAWRDPDQTIAYDAAGSGNNGNGGSNITWTHVVGSGANRFIVIGVSIRTVTVSVLNVTVGAQSAILLRNDVQGSQVVGEIWYLVNPDSGSQTVTVELSGVSKASGGSVSYTGVNPASPIDNHQGVSYSGSIPSISLTTNAVNACIFSNLAISGTATVVAEGNGQVHRFYEIGTGGSGTSRAGIDGDDKPTTSPGSYSMSWNMSFYSDVIAQAVAIKPAPSPVGHVDFGILILKSDGSIRTTIATNTASSTDLTSVPTTLSGSYSWTTYASANQSDYLEVDYAVEVTSATAGVTAYLRVDDSALPTIDQTRITGIMLPSEYTAEVELIGLSNTFSWTQLVWTMDAAWTTDAVTTVIQLYNYTAAAYPTSGDGFTSYTTSATPNTEEAKTQTITTNPSSFRDAVGNWKIKVKGIKTVDKPFDFEADWIELKPTYYSEQTVSTEFLFSSLINETPTQLNFTIVAEYTVANVAVTIQAWNYSSSAYANSGQGSLKYVSSGANDTILLSISANQQFYTSNGNAKIQIAGALSTTTPFRQKTNQIKLVYSYVPTNFQVPFDWFKVLLYVWPAPLAILLVWFLGFKRKKKSKSHTYEITEAFSAQFGMAHEEMMGKKMLLEIDPTSDYQNVLSGFVTEAKNAGEPLFILTNKNSTLHSVFSEDPNVNFLLFTSKTSYPQRISEKETLLPGSDLSVVLDECVKIQKSESTKPVNILLDHVSDVIARCGFDRTYKFLRLLLEASSSSSATGLFVFIPTAHDQEVSSLIRGLFRTQLAYTKSGPEVGNL